MRTDQRLPVRRLLSAAGVSGGRRAQSERGSRDQGRQHRAGRGMDRPAYVRGVVLRQAQEPVQVREVRRAVRADQRLPVRRLRRPPAAAAAGRG